MHITVEKCWSRGKGYNEQGLGNSSWPQTFITSLYSKALSVFFALWEREKKSISLDKKFFKSDAHSQAPIKLSEHRGLRGSKLNISGLQKRYKFRINQTDHLKHKLSEGRIRTPLEQ